MAIDTTAKPALVRILAERSGAKDHAAPAKQPCNPERHRGATPPLQEEPPPKRW